jgi:hypothetical protein
LIWHAVAQSAIFVKATLIAVVNVEKLELLDVLVVIMAAGFNQDIRAYGIPPSAVRKHAEGIDLHHSFCIEIHVGSVLRTHFQGLNV